MIYFIQPPLAHISGGTIYNLEIIKYLKRDLQGEELVHALDSGALTLVEHIKNKSNRDIFVLDGLYLSVPSFKDSIGNFAPYMERIYLMLHYLESMNTYYSSQEQQTLWYGEKLWLDAVRGIVVPSIQLREHLSQGGVEKNKVTVAFPAIAKTQTISITDLEERADHRTINLITVGTVCQRKGQLDLVKMLAQIPHSHITLHLIGDQQSNEIYTKEIIEFIAHEQMQDCVVLHGNLPQAKIFELFPQCDLYLSLSTYENYPMAIAEAIAHGLPILTYITGAIGDWVKNNINGILIENGHQENFYQALNDLLTDPQMLKQLQRSTINNTNKIKFNSGEETYQDFLRVFNQS